MSELGGEFIRTVGAYSIATNQEAISRLFRVMNRYVGNLAPMPGVFPDYPAPVMRNLGAEREMTLMRWGMPPPPKFGGPPVTNIRNTSSPHWRGWLKPENRCLVPFNSFAEYAPEEPGDQKRRMLSGSQTMTTGRWSHSPVSGQNSSATAAPSQSQSPALI